MPDLNIDELLAEQSKESILNSMLDAAETIGLPMRSWSPIGPGRTLFSATASVLAKVAIPIRSMIAGAYLERATGPWLTLLARYVYGVERIGASFATGPIKFSNASALPFSFDAFDVVIISEVNGKTYRNAVDITIPAFASDVSTGCIAIEIGSASNAAIGQIDRFETPVAGLTVTNTGAVVGSDEESDEALRARCKARIQALSPNGAAGSYEFIAKSTLRPDGTVIGINRVLVSSSSSQAEVKVWLADPDGAPEESDRALIEAAIFTQCVPNGITPYVLPAIEVTVNVSYTCHAIASEGLTSEEIEQKVQDALLKLFAEYPIGGRRKSAGSGRLWTETVRSTIAKAHPAIFDASLSGFSDVLLNDARVAVLGVITPNVVIEET